ncbi:M20/M25/M40 family metallo-hydrolase [Marinigracilibium pacificum]|uniref:M20/M25/M40 family metallo-hydrolase n=1 Tax=Marinigracilibium pacificum TaxID=2729599 RepID=A0A848J1P0_9BACT|nr:M20/M25/M40 family metallo-hydrolase [Marinigracilibium pacificum]NMM48394.1 M20/M25/M40 family metallo-hydrolase [Marinigracilibium pacificum]
MRKRVKVFYVLLVVFVLTILILLVKTFMFTSQQPVAFSVERKSIDTQDLESLSELLKLETIASSDRKSEDSSDFDLVLPWIRNNYPLISSNCDIQIINNSGVLIKVEGKDSGLSPDLLAAHIDVVPIPENQLELWNKSPYGGEYDSEFVYGRGTLDDKGSAFAILEAVEELLKNNGKPIRTTYLAFGFDEETGGTNGAMAIAKYFSDSGIKLNMALDEGSVVTKGIVPGLAKNAAIIGIAEKGYVTFKLESVAEAGHSSMPARDNAVNKLVEVLEKIRKEPFKARLSKPLKAFIQYLGPEMPFPEKMVFANTWLFDDLLISTYEAIPSGNAMVRTTSAVTIIDAGVKDNVVPSSASATINFRILPGDNIDAIEKYLKHVIGESDVRLTRYDEFAKEPSKVSSHESDSYQRVASVIAGTFDNTVVVPGLVIAGTDGRHYESIAENVYRFSPFVLESEDLERIHGNNERISIENLNSAKTFFYNLLIN